MRWRQGKKMRLATGKGAYGDDGFVDVRSIENHSPNYLGLRWFAEGWGRGVCGFVIGLAWLGLA